MTDDSNVTNLFEYRAQKKRLEDIASGRNMKGMGAAELSHLVQSLAKVVLQQHDLITTVSTELAQTAATHQQMQEQFMFVSAQAFCAIEMLKEKDVCSAEEFHELWTKTVEEKILKPQGQQPEEVGELLLDEVDEDSTP